MKFSKGSATAALQSYSELTVVLKSIRQYITYTVDTTPLNKHQSR